MPILLVVFQIGAVTLAVLAGVGALALTRQGFELAVLHSRGFRRGVLLAAQAIQAVFAAIVAFPLGLLLGMGLAALASTANGPDLPGVVFPIRLNATAQLLGLVAAVVGGVILLGLSVPYVSRTVLEERRAASREDRPLLARVPVELFVLPLGVFAFLQLRTGTRPEAGSGEIDPLILRRPDPAAVRRLVPRAPAPAPRVPRTRLPDRSIEALAEIPRGTPDRTLAGDRFRRRPAAAAVDGAPRRLHVVPRHRAPEPRGRGARAGGRRLARRTSRRPRTSCPCSAACRRSTTPVVRTEPRIESRAASSSHPIALGIDPVTYADAGWWREDFSDTPAGRDPPSAGGTGRSGWTCRPRLDAAHVRDGRGPPRCVHLAVDGDGRRRGRGRPHRPAPADRSGARDLRAAARRRRPAAVDHDPSDLAGRARRGRPSSFSRSPSTASRSSLDGLGAADVARQRRLRRARGRPGLVRDDSGASDVIGGIVPRVRSPARPGLPRHRLHRTGPVFPATLGGQELELDPVASAIQFPSMLPNAPFIVRPAPRAPRTRRGRARARPGPERGLGRGRAEPASRCSGRRGSSRGRSRGRHRSRGSSPNSRRASPSG